MEEDKRIMQHQEYLKNRTTEQILEDKLEEFKDEIRNNDSPPGTKKNVY